MEYAFRVQVYEKILYLEFYIVFSEPFMNNKILAEAAYGGGEGDVPSYEKSEL